MGKGCFVSLDGVDGAGKSTQCRLLYEWLTAQGYQVTACRDPGGTPVGDEIRSLLLHHRSEMSVLCEALLYMASRAELLQTIIRPALAAGGMVLCDRYLLANVVYQGHAGGLGPELIWELGTSAASGLLPDLTLVLDLPVKEAAARRTHPPDRIEGRGPEFAQRVREGFLAEARRHPEQIRLIDASLPVEMVQEALRKEIARVLG